MRALALLICLLFSAPSWATTKWVDLSGAGTGSANGSSLSNLCAGYSDADCLPVPGDTLELCNTLVSGNINASVSGTASSQIVWDFICPGGTPGSITGGSIFFTGLDYNTVQFITINGTANTNSSGIGVFSCESSLQPSSTCSGREGTGKGFKILNPTIINPGKSGVEFGTTKNQSSYSAMTDIVVDGAVVINPGAHGTILSGYIVNPVYTNNYVTGANRTAISNAWGIYIAPRAYSQTGGWTDALQSTGPDVVQTCAGGAARQYKITLGTGITAVGSTETVKEMVFANLANGHYTQQSIASCGEGGAGLTGTRRWCQATSVIHVCGAASEFTTLAAINANSAVFVLSDSGPATVGPGNEATLTNSNNGTQDGVGIGSDTGAKNIKFVGNYAHHNQGSGFNINMCSGASGSCTLNGNLSAYNTKYGYLISNPANQTDVVSLYNDTAWGNTLAPIQLSAAGSTAVQAYNNIVGGTNGVNCSSTNLAVSGGGEGGNFYLNCTPTNLPTAITGSPGFLGGLAPATPEGFCLDSTSSLLGAGSVIGAYVLGYGNESFPNPPPIGARGLCKPRRIVGARRSASR